ncbi:MAG: FtsX-like permease family protein [Chloroflexi bacterium]|nr:ABC transporter permease [Anaerolineaceae bacterium]NMB88000.1 FtsX-like permease family protein [Chloroflexota bacterium]
MSLSEVIHMAWKSLLSNKSRSLLTMLGVIIGVAAVIVMMAISAGTEAEISDAITGLGSNLIYIRSAMTRGGPGQSGGNQAGLVYDDVLAVRDSISGIDGVSVEQSTTETVKYENVTLDDITLVGTTPDYTSVRDIDVATGRFINETEQDRASKVVVLGSSVAEELFGDADPIGQIINVGTVKLTVVGVMAEKGLVSGTNFDEQIYMPISLVFKKFTPSMFARIMGDSVRVIYVAVDEDADMDNVILQISLLLAKRHDVSLDSADFTVETQQDIIDTQASTTASFRTLLGWVAGVSLIVGGIGIMNIMLVSVTERTREIGLRQAVGATPYDIQVQFLSEALMLSLLGGMLGVLCGVGGSYLFGQLGDMRTVILPYSIILSFTSAALVGIFFGYVPAQKAAQLDPIDALRHD